jgi:hypothetical protein
MSYLQAKARLRKALGKAAAGAGPVAIVWEVFGGEDRRPLEPQ